MSCGQEESTVSRVKAQSIASQLDIQQCQNVDKERFLNLSHTYILPPAPPPPLPPPPKQQNDGF